MKLSATLSLYLSRSYIMNLLFILLGLLAIVYLFDTVELIRRAEKRDNVPMMLVLQMGLLKLPEVGQMLLPFAVLFSAMFTFWQMSRRSELIVIRSAGYSAWQLMAPIATIALAAGLLQITLINPIGALLVSKFEDMERTYLSKQENQIALFDEGLWMRQVKRPQNTQTIQETDIPDYNYVIIHAQSINPTNWELKNVMALHFDQNDKFILRIDAPLATLRQGAWNFSDVKLNIPGKKAVNLKNYTIATSLTPHDIEDSFASTTSMSFWNLPNHIKTLEKTGFDATRLKVYYQSLFAQPLLFIAMILLAAAVSMRPPRNNGTFLLISIGIAIGFTVFFMSSFLQAIGSSGQIPTFMAAWTAPIVCLLFGIATILHLEDG